jgi:DNA-directed RNA polymerase subunit RPC12/RpoP
MGCYDTIWANIKCAKCGKIQTAFFQTKDLECELKILCEGDTTVYFDEYNKEAEENDLFSTEYEFIMPSAQYYCESCKSKLEDRKSVV